MNHMQPAFSIPRLPPMYRSCFAICLWQDLGLMFGISWYVILNQLASSFDCVESFWSTCVWLTEHAALGGKLWAGACLVGRDVPTVTKWALENTNCSAFKGSQGQTPFGQIGRLSQTFANQTEITWRLDVFMNVDKSLGLRTCSFTSQVHCGTRALQLHDEFWTDCTRFLFIWHCGPLTCRWISHWEPWYEPWLWLRSNHPKQQGNSI